MKKVVCLILAVLMLLSMTACGASEGGAVETTETKAPGFRVGYGKANITPETGVPMGGYGRSDQRISTGTLSYLWATCIAITDADDNTILLYGLDLCNSAEAYNHFAVDVSKATDVPVDNIVMSASHTHSAPDYSMGEIPGISEALAKLKKGLVKAAEDAMEDRKEAKMFVGSVETEGMNFVRHYICNDGTYCGDNFGSSASGYAGHATDADPMLQLVKFVREGDNDVYLTNFQTHPHQTGGSSQFNISADIVGEYRAKMEEELGCEVLYFSGAGGNINSRSRINEENQTVDWKDWGKRMAKYAQSVEFTEVATGKVQATKFQFEAKINHELDAMAGVCRDLRDRWNKGEITYADVTELGKAYGLSLNSPYHAGAIANRANMDSSASFPIWAYSFGDVGFVAAPYEMFDTNGMFIKENSPFKMTIIATISNKTNGYFPSEFAFTVSGGYEVDTTSYVGGTAERLADQYVEMLTQQFNNK
jgi:hypothetical protein